MTPVRGRHPTLSLPVVVIVAAIVLSLARKQATALKPATPGAAAEAAPSAIR
ncbi:hypothetical protein [Roseateles sp. LKC17W]|uniref:Uncharacterized protein n=1 Tax=Pelomonas margarita TaxID=3299031 RepID=A0ABW7FH98_9BURK